MRPIGCYVKVLYKDINLIKIMILIDKNLLARINYEKYLSLLCGYRYCTLCV